MQRLTFLQFEQEVIEYIQVSLFRLFRDMPCGLILLDRSEGVFRHYALINTENNDIDEITLKQLLRDNKRIVTEIKKKFPEYQNYLEEKIAEMSPPEAKQPAVDLLRYIAGVNTNAPKSLIYAFSYLLAAIPLHPFMLIAGTCLAKEYEVGANLFKEQLAALKASMISRTPKSENKNDVMYEVMGAKNVDPFIYTDKNYKQLDFFNTGFLELYYLLITMSVIRGHNVHELTYLAKPLHVHGEFRGILFAWHNKIGGSKDLKYRENLQQIAQQAEWMLGQAPNLTYIGRECVSAPINPEESFPSKILRHLTLACNPMLGIESDSSGRVVSLYARGSSADSHRTPWKTTDETGIKSLNRFEWHEVESRYEEPFLSSFNKSAAKVGETLERFPLGFEKIFIHSSQVEQVLQKNIIDYYKGCGFPLTLGFRFRYENKFIDIFFAGSFHKDQLQARSFGLHLYGFFEHVRLVKQHQSIQSIRHDMSKVENWYGNDSLDIVIIGDKKTKILEELFRKCISPVEQPNLSQFNLRITTYGGNELTSWQKQLLSTQNDRLLPDVLCGGRFVFINDSERQKEEVAFSAVSDLKNYERLFTWYIGWSEEFFNSGSRIFDGTLQSAFQYPANTYLVFSDMVRNYHEEIEKRRELPIKYILVANDRKIGRLLKNSVYLKEWWSCCPELASKVLHVANINPSVIPQLEEAANVLSSTLIIYLDTQANPGSIAEYVSQLSSASRGEKKQIGATPAIYGRAYYKPFANYNVTSWENKDFNRLCRLLLTAYVEQKKGTPVRETLGSDSSGKLIVNDFSKLFQALVETLNADNLLNIPSFEKRNLKQGAQYTKYHWNLNVKLVDGIKAE
jgi:hypothetical protein